MSLDYIRSFLLEKIPNIIHFNDDSKKITEIMFDLNCEYAESPTLLLTHTDNTTITICTEFLGIKITMEVGATATLELDGIKFSRMVSKDDLFAIWAILETNQKTLDELITTFCKELEMKSFGEKMTSSAQQVLFVEFMAYYTILISKPNLYLKNNDENTFLYPWLF